MAHNLLNILGWAPLTEALRTTSSGVPNPLPDSFFTVKPRNRILGTKAKYNRISGERRTATRVKYGSPATAWTPRDVGETPVTMMHTLIEFPIDANILQMLRSTEKYAQDMGMDWLNYQFEAAGKVHQNNRIIMVASVLRYGAIYWDSAGNLLPSSAGADASLTISFGMSANHQNQCNTRITASWDLPTTDIPGDIQNLQDYALQETGMPLTTCFYGNNVRKYISQNSFCQAYLSRNPTYNAKYQSTSSELPDGLFGIDKWIRMSGMFYEDANGTNQSIWDDDLAVFTPDISQPDKMDWWAMYEGSYQVPNSLNVGRDGMAALNNFRTEYGMFSYAYTEIQPSGIQVVHGDTCLASLKNPNAIFQADTAF